MCAAGGGRGVRNKEASKHREPVSSKAHKYSGLVLISPAHTHTRTHTLPRTHTHAHAPTHSSTDRSGSPAQTDRQKLSQTTSAKCSPLRGEEGGAEGTPPLPASTDPAG